MPDPVEWPVLLGELIRSKQVISELDEEGLEKVSIPRVKIDQAELDAYERGIGEGLPRSYREFLLHANGWQRIYFRMDLFGLPELRGEGSWKLANALLTVYAEDGVLGAVELDPNGVIPIGAGEGMRDLLLIVREGWPDAGQISWIDGEEIGRFPDLSDFFIYLIQQNEIFAERLRLGDT